jgi:hypothetical protein
MLHTHNSLKTLESIGGFMKKTILFGFCVLLASFAYAQDVVLLDVAIQGAGQDIVNALRRGSTVVVYQFESPKEKFSNYVLDELTDILVKSGKVKVVDRKNQNLIDAELDFQFNESSGNISDDTLASLTDRLGAQAMLIGTLQDNGDYYRFRVRALNTSAQVIAVYSTNIAKEEAHVKSLLASNTSTTSIHWFAAGTLNIAFGLGSYLNGDIAGGLTVSAGYLAGAGLIIWELVGIKKGDALENIPGNIGIGLLCLSAVYGFVRPFVVRNQPQLAFIADNVNIALIPNNTGKNVVRLSYQFSY